MNWKDFVINLRGIKLLGDQNQLLNVVAYLHDIGEVCVIVMHGIRGGHS